MRRTGIADLPLHGGRAPSWLFQRMSRLAGAVTEAVVLESGPREFLRRLSDPFWFQAFGCLLGFDWHSSGVTTTVCGALKVGMAGRDRDVGILVAGGKGRTSRRTPHEIESWGRLPGLSAEPLVYASRLSAKVDSAAVQDGFTLYHHAFFAASDGSWVVVQQGMHESRSGCRTWRQGTCGRSCSPPMKSSRPTSSGCWGREGWERALSARSACCQSSSTARRRRRGIPPHSRSPTAAKDGIPYPVDRETYDRTIDALSTAISSARLGRSDRLAALRRLTRYGAVASAS